MDDASERARASESEWTGARVVPRWGVIALAGLLAAAAAAGVVRLASMREPFAAGAERQLEWTLGAMALLASAALVLWSRRHRTMPGVVASPRRGLSWNGTLVARSISSWRSVRAFDGGGAHVALTTPDGDRFVVATRDASDLEELLAALGVDRLTTSRPLRELGRYPSAFGVVTAIGVALLAGVLVGGPRFAAWPFTLAGLTAAVLAVAYPLRTRCRVEVGTNRLVVRRRTGRDVVPLDASARVESAFGPRMIVWTPARGFRFGGSREAILDLVVAARVSRG